MADRKSQADGNLADWERSLTAEEKQQLSLSGQTLRVPFDETEGDRVLPIDGQNAKDAAAAAPGKITGPAAWKPGKAGNALAFVGETFVDLGQRGVFDRAEPVSFGAWIYPTSNEAMAVLLQNRRRTGVSRIRLSPRRCKAGRSHRPSLAG